MRTEGRPGERPAGRWPPRSRGERPRENPRPQASTITLHQDPRRDPQPPAPRDNTRLLRRPPRLCSWQPRKGRTDVTPCPYRAQSTPFWDLRASAEPEAAAHGRPRRSPRPPSSPAPGPRVPLTPASRTGGVAAPPRFLTCGSRNSEAREHAGCAQTTKPLLRARLPEALARACPCLSTRPAALWGDTLHLARGPKSGGSARISRHGPRVTSPGSLDPGMSPGLSEGSGKAGGGGEAAVSLW